MIGEITGSELPYEIVGIGAHLDSWNVGTAAIDDGMGVGMVLATVHHIAELDKRPNRVIFCCRRNQLLRSKTIHGTA